MELQPSLRYTPEGITVLNFAAMMLNPRSFTTRVTLFPGSYATPTFQTWGDFFITFSIYREGKLLGRIHSEQCTTEGVVEVDLDRLTDLYDSDTSLFVHAAYSHTNEVPVELYFSHVHRETGVYISYPALAFMGDLNFPRVHREQLENTLFWPGVCIEEGVEASIVVLNPYRMRFGFQASLFLPGGKRQQTPIRHIGSHRLQILSLEELFPGSEETIRTNQGRCAICVAAQHKVAAYSMLRSKKSGAATVIDHFHTYCLY